MDAPFRVEVFTKNLGFRFTLEAWASATIELRLDAISTATFVFPLTNLRAWSVQRGDRVLITDADGRHLLSGPCFQRSAKGKEPEDAMATLSFADDWWLFQRTLAWVQPAKGIDQQASDDSTAAWKATGPAETVCKNLFRSNVVARYGAPVTVMPDLGRGATTTVTARMNPLADRLWPALTLANVGATVRQVRYGTGWRIEMDCYSMQVRNPVIGPSQPMLGDWTYTESGPDALKGVVGGQGQGNARIFRQGSLQAEVDRVGLLYGGEHFEDSRQESTVAGLDAALAAELAAKASTARASFSLVETGRWRYGTAWKVGDIVRFQLARLEPTVHVPVVAATLSDTPDEGYVVTATADYTATPMDRRASKNLVTRIRSLEGA